MKYIAFTNVYNEEKNIEKTFKMVYDFDLRPELWVWIDDGSIDGTLEEINRCIYLYGFNMPSIVVKMPKKAKGDLGTIGKGYNQAFEQFNLLKYDFDFMTIIAVDNVISTEYYSKIDDLFTTDRRIGVISGAHINEKLKMPMGGSKCVRWEIIKNIKGKFWDPAPDAFINIKAHMMGYKWLILYDDWSIIGGPTSARKRTKAGAYYAGKLWSYVGGNTLGAIQRVIYRFLKQQNGIDFWHGYKENKDWKCSDSDVREYYKSKWDFIINFLKKFYNRIMVKSVDNDDIGCNV